MDGPFGAPTSQIFRAQHAVLIGTGIGVTPFASILQSIMHRYWQARNVCPKCQYSWTENLTTSVLNLKKVPWQSNPYNLTLTILLYHAYLRNPTLPIIP